MNWEPVSGRRKQGRLPKIRWAIFKEDLHAMVVTWRGAEASDRNRWKKLVAQCVRGDGKNGRTARMCWPRWLVKY